MERIPLNLTIISAKDLKDIQMIGKQNLYAVISINGDEETKQKTKVEKDCGTKPKWKHQMQLTVDDAAVHENRLNLVIEIVADRHIIGDKPIGKVIVPLKELLDQNNEDKEEKVKYDVILPNGKVKGTLKFSFKFGDKYTVGGPVSVDHSEYLPQGHGDVGAYGYPPQGPGYGYPPPGPYGYPEQHGHGESSHKLEKSGSGAGLGVGLGVGLVGGYLVSEAIDDATDDAADDDDDDMSDDSD